MIKFTRILFLALNLIASFMLTACGGGGGGELPSGDTTAPVIESTIPKSGDKTSTNIALEIKFNEPVKLPDTTNVDIYPYTNDSLDQTKRVPLKTNPFSVNGNTLTIKPIVDLGANPNALKADTKYHVYLHGIKDKANNVMSDCRWEFATLDYLGSITSSDKPCNTTKPISVITGLTFTTPTSTVSESGTPPSTPSKAIITVTRSNSTNEVTVEYATVAGTPAGVGKATVSDFTKVSGTLTFLTGETSKVITVLITDDSLDEPDETFTVVLSNPTGISLGETTTHTVTITVNDSVQPPIGQPGRPGTLAFASGTTSVNESAGPALVRVTRSGGSTGSVTVAYATSNGSALAGTNYLQTTGILTFTDGDSTPQDIPVPIINDNAASGNKDFTVTLSAPTGNAKLNVSSNLVTITDAGVVVIPPSRQLTTAELIAIWSLLL